jgi:hypothetical protein
LKPEVEGRGGGYGRFQGLKLAEIQVLFDKCIEEPSMRSISAVLRITREQLDARGQLGIYPLFAWIAGAACAVGLAIRLIGPHNMSEIATKTALGAGTVFLLLLGTTIPGRTIRRTNVEQEKLIRKMAVDSLAKILEHNPTLKPLTIEQETTVKILLRKTESAESIRALL